MSREAIVAKRYAKALFELANEQGVANQAETELASVLQIAEANPELLEVLHHPTIEASKKQALLKAVFESQVSLVVLNALNLLVARKRGRLLKEFVESYIRIAQEALGQATAIVRSAFPISASQSKAIADQLKATTGKTIRVESIVDSKLIGGIQIQLNGTLYDGSVAGQLVRLQHAMRNAQAL